MSAATDAYSSKRKLAHCAYIALNLNKSRFSNDQESDHADAR
jgi:hypothetical protein